jgi:aminoglycoside phosphotransferase (APT) family kinase protein
VGLRRAQALSLPTAKRVAFREAAIHAAVEALGLPVPAVGGVLQIGDRWGIVFERVMQAPFAERMRDDPPLAARYLASLAGLHACIHAQPAPGFGSLKLRLAADIARAKRLARSQAQTLLRRLAAMPDGERLCHGDFHPRNVLGDFARPMIIDWPDASRGEPAADVCRSWLLLKLHAEDLAEPYLDAYCRTGGMPRQTVLGWLSYVAAARLAEDVGGEADRLLDLIRQSWPREPVRPGPAYGQRR